MIAPVYRRIVIWLLSGIAAVLMATGCGTSAVDAASEAGARVSSGSTPGLRLWEMYKVPSGSMEPTLPIGTRVVVKQRPLNVGAIVVFHPPKGAREQRCGPTHYEVSPGGAACDQTNPEESSEKFIKRIVAGPGDTIYVKEGHAIVNGKRESDPYIKVCDGVRECDFLTPVKIPPGNWFMLGDNRGESDDSRFWGPVPTGWIVGTVTDLECPRFHGGLTWVHRTSREGCNVHAR
jgi:signal peptidase I